MCPSSWYIKQASFFVGTLYWRLAACLTIRVSQIWLTMVGKGFEIIMRLTFVMSGPDSDQHVSKFLSIQVYKHKRPWELRDTNLMLAGCLIKIVGVKTSFFNTSCMNALAISKLMISTLSRKYFHQPFWIIFWICLHQRKLHYRFECVVWFL